MRTKLSNDCSACYAKGVLSTLIGRHCLTCGHTVPLTQDEAIRQGELKLHKKPEPETGDFLISVLKQYGVTLPKNAIEWRVAKAGDDWLPLGSHPLYTGSVRALVTDGIVAWFALGDGRLIFGHLAAFTSSSDKVKSKAKPESKAKRLQRLLDEI